MNTNDNNAEPRYSCPELRMSITGTNLMRGASMEDIQLVVRKGTFHINKTPVRGKLGLHVKHKDTLLLFTNGRALPEDATDIEKRLLLNDISNEQPTATLQSWESYLNERNSEKVNIIKELNSL